MAWTYEYFQELKSEVSNSPMVENNIVEMYTIRVLHRGEQLFYHDKEKNRALIVEIQIRNGCVFGNSILNWDNGEKVSTLEKEFVLERILRYFRNVQQIEGYIK